MELSAIQDAEMDTMVSDQCAGRAVPLVSEMMEPIVSSQALMEEELVMLFGIEIIASVITEKLVAREMVLYTTQDAELDSVPSDAVYAPLYVHQV